MSMRPTLLAAVSSRKEMFDLLMEHAGGKLAAAKAAVERPRTDVCEAEALVGEAAACLETLARVAGQVEMMTGRPSALEVTTFVSQTVAELHDMAGQVAFCKVVTRQGDARKRRRRLEN